MKELTMRRSGLPGGVERSGHARFRAAIRLWTVALLACAAATSAVASPTVFVHPSELVVQPGETFSMSIRVDAGTDTVTCFLTEFTFDADVIELVTASEGSLFGMCGYATMYHWDVVESGCHSCNDVALGFESHALPPGELVDLEFTAGSGEGMTIIDITTVDLRDMRREPILPVGNAPGIVFVVDPTGVEDSPEHGAARLELTPNPCRDTAAMAWAAPRGARGASLVISDVRGRLVWHELLDGDSGVVRWNGRARDGARTSAGVYFVELHSGGETVRRKLVLLR